MPLSPASWPEGGGGGGSDLLQTLTFALTAQEIKDSTLTPVEIIPAQGAGTMVVPTMYAFSFQAGATPFNLHPLELVIGDFNANSVAIFLTSATDVVGWTFGPNYGGVFLGVSEGGDPADYLNVPIRLRAALRGAIVTSRANEAGLDYAVGDTGTIDDGSPNATYIIDAVGDLGVVVAYTITDGGDGYNLSAGGAPSQWVTTPGGAQAGIGSGFTVLVESVDASGSAGDGTLSGVVYYLVADLS